MKRFISLSTVCLFISFWLLFASDPGTSDWPMWGGTPDRNMVSLMKGIPTAWDIKTKKNVKWVAQLGSQSYGNPVVSGGQVYVGTNNELVRNPKEGGDRGVLMCFRESDGKFLWQHTNEKLPAGRALDWPYQGVCSSPLVEGDRLYYVSNRCELICLDTHGDGNGNAKVIWKFDMIEQVGSSPHNMSSSSPVSYGDLIFVSTSNGQDESHVHIPSPRAPSMVAVNKKTGKLVWEVNNVGERILHGQWSSPSTRPSAATSLTSAASGVATKSAARFQPAPSTTGCCFMPTSAASCIAWTSTPASRTGHTTCFRPSGARRW